MQAIIMEHEGCFSIDLHAETLGEAALLTRMGIDARERINCIATYVQEARGENGHAIDLTGNKEAFCFNLVLAKSKAANNNLPRRHKRCR